MMDHRFRYLTQQRTLASAVAFVGRGLRTGKHVNLQIRGAPARSGITVARQDLPAGERHFAVRPENMVGGHPGLTLANRHGHAVAGLENVLSALYGLGIDNAHIELNGPEAPVLDGSAAPIVAACVNGGILPLDAVRDVLVIMRPVRLQHGDSWAELQPELSPGISIAIDSPHPDIGYQHLESHLTPGIYESQIAPARIFGFIGHSWHTRARGLVMTESMSNAILLDDAGIANREDMRFRDDFVRRSALDALAVLALAGVTIVGELRGFQLSFSLVKKLLQLVLSHKASTGLIPATALFVSPDSDTDGALRHPANLGTS